MVWKEPRAFLGKRPCCGLCPPGRSARLVGDSPFRVHLGLTASSRWTRTRTSRIRRSRLGQGELRRITPVSDAYLHVSRLPPPKISAVLACVLSPVAGFPIEIRRVALRTREVAFVEPRVVHKSLFQRPPKGGPRGTSGRHPLWNHSFHVPFGPEPRASLYGFWWGHRCPRQSIELWVNHACSAPRPLLTMMNGVQVGFFLIIGRGNSSGSSFLTVSRYS